MSKSISVTALDGLKKIHEGGIKQIDSELMSQNWQKIQAERDKETKESIPKYIKALESVIAPFDLETKNACDIRTNNNQTITFTLRFNPDRHKPTRLSNDSIEEINKARIAATCNLEEWYKQALYKIAGKKEVEQFVIKK